MGTRNLVKVIDQDGVLRVAQYGQFDGYPSGQGVTALYHLRYNFGENIAKRLGRVRWATQAELDAVYSSLPNVNYLGTDDSKTFALLYPNLSRETSADILAVVAWSVGEVVLVNSASFEDDELMCEGVYTVDFQRKVFISKFGGVVVEHPLDNLPEPDEYLQAWQSVDA